MTDATNNDLPEMPPAISQSGCGNNCEGCDSHEDIGGGEDMELDTESQITIHMNEADTPMEAAFQQFLEATTEPEALAGMTNKQMATIRFAYNAGAIDALRIVQEGVALIDNEGGDQGNLGYSMGELMGELQESVNEDFSEVDSGEAEDDEEDEEDYPKARSVLTDIASKHF